MSADPTLAARDGHLQRAFDSLEASGLELMDDERHALADAAAEGHLGAHMRLLRRALLLSADTERQAALARRWVRRERSAAEEALIEAADRMEPGESHWEAIDGGTGFRHRPCGKPFRGFVDPVQTREQADAHHAQCAAVARG